MNRSRMPRIAIAQGKPCQLEPDGPSFDALVQRDSLRLAQLHAHQPSQQVAGFGRGELQICRP